MTPMSDQKPKPRSRKEEAGQVPLPDGSNAKSARRSKAEQLRALLERPDGATIDEICATLLWQKHSARAAISTMRKAGHAVERAPGSDGISHYRLTVVQP